MLPQIVGRASGPIIGGYIVDVYPAILRCGRYYLRIEHGELRDNDGHVFPPSDPALSRDMAEQVQAIRAAYRESLGRGR